MWSVLPQVKHWRTRSMICHYKIYCNRSRSQLLIVINLSFGVMILASIGYYFVVFHSQNEIITNSWWVIWKFPADISFMFVPKSMDWLSSRWHDGGILMQNILMASALLPDNKGYVFGALQVLNLLTNCSDWKTISCWKWSGEMFPE